MAAQCINPCGRALRFITVWPTFVTNKTIHKYKQTTVTNHNQIFQNLAKSYNHNDQKKNPKPGLYSQTESP